MELKDVLNAVLTGDFDENLDGLVQAVKDRKEAKNRVMFYSLKPGDKVRFCRQTRPRYLACQTGTLKELRNKKVTVDLDSPVGKFWKGIITPVDLIEKI